MTNFCICNCYDGPSPCTYPNCFLTGALSLSLSTRFLKQLASIFGDEVDDGVEACKLDIDYDLATAIYNAWKQSKTPVWLFEFYLSRA